MANIPLGAAAPVLAEMLAHPGAAGEALVACLASTDSIVGLFDGDDQLHYANEAYSKRFLRDAPRPICFSDVLRHGFAKGFGVHVSSGDIERFVADVQTRRRSRPFRAFEVDLTDGGWIWMTETLLPSGWMLSIGSDITSLKHNERTLRQAHERALFAAQTDFLTGLPNRRHVMERAEALVQTALSEERPFSIASIDIDHFKRINDTCGHDSGDDVLRHFAKACLSALREGDLVGRTGGEEFLLLLPGASGRVASNILQRLRRCVHAGCGERSHPYTFSAGIAEAESGDCVAALLKRADQALYSAKANGRDRTEWRFTQH